MRRRGVEAASRDALGHLQRPELDGFWIHSDCDALDDGVMPAVDYRLPGGLSWGELEVVVAIAIDSKQAVGLEITIFNPTLDRDGSIAHALVTSVARGLAGSRHRSRPCP